jgi:putative hemolysin
MSQPVISLLSVSTDAVLRIFRIRKIQQPVISLDEFKVLVEQATAQGV